MKTTDDYKESLMKELRNLKSQGVMKSLTKRVSFELGRGKRELEKTFIMPITNAEFCLN